ncbi:MAG: hypothetical protein K2N58_01100, partial [Treponemataceae bacterium]|nr:hypothetical protein [Treponemataceae bacterium]
AARDERQSSGKSHHDKEKFFDAFHKAPPLNKIVIHFHTAVEYKITIQTYKKNLSIVVAKKMCKFIRGFVLKLTTVVGMR